MKTLISTLALVLSVSVANVALAANPSGVGTSGKERAKGPGQRGQHSTQPAPQIECPCVALIGDSNFSLLGSNFKLNGYTVVNLGVKGINSKGYLARLSQRGFTISGAEEILSMLGTNDALGNSGKPEQTPEQYRASYGKVIEKLKSLANTTVIGIMDNESNIDVSAYQNVARSLALEHGVSYVEMRGRFSPGFTLNEKVRVHLTPEAQEQFKAILSEALQ